MSNRIRDIAGQGQAVWLDFISRELLESGGLRELIAEGVTGVTSNPTIFQKSISTGRAYDAQLRELTRAGKTTNEIYEALVLDDITQAADELRSVYDQTGGADGFVSLEVNPALAHDAAGTIDQARRLFVAVERPNLMIKVPATKEGLPAIATLIGEGINVNVTLIFALSMYEKVMRAYLDGLERLKSSGEPLSAVSSVASFFVSRVDTLTDKLLSERIAQGATQLEPLLGQAANANAILAYRNYQRVFESETFAPLRAAGARVQRPLWASTSTKSPAYPDTKYVDPLIGPNTVNTIPPATLDAIRDHGTAERTIDRDAGQADGIMRSLAEAGIDFDAVTDQLLTNGVKAFADSFDTLMGDIEGKRAGLSASTTSAAAKS